MGAYGLAVAAAFAVAFAVLLSSSDKVEAAATLEVTTLEWTAGTGNVVVTISGHDVDDHDDNPSTPDTQGEWWYKIIAPVETNNVACVARNTDGTAGETTTGNVVVVPASTAYRLIAYDAAGCERGDEIADISYSLPVVTSETATVSAVPGDSKSITFDASADTFPASPTFRIVRESVGSATFENDSANITCEDGTAPCDLDEVTGLITLRVNVADDSSRGPIYVEHYTRAGGNFVVASADQKTITVTRAAAPAARLKVAADPKSIGTTGTTTITATVTKANGDVVPNSAVTLVISGVPAEFDDPDCGATDGTGYCKVNTNGAGQVMVDLDGQRVSGTATVTVTHGTNLSGSVDVVIHSGAASLSAELFEGTIQPSGADNWIFLTVLDSSARPIQGVEPSVSATSGPGAEVVGDASATYAAGTSIELPACEDGTDKDGKCAIKLNAPKGALAGDHTVTVRLARSGKDALTDKVTVEVVGKPTDMQVTAPETVEPGSDSDIVVTLYDANGKMAAANKVTVRRIEGDGLVEPEGGKDTRNGTATFTFTAPTQGTVVLIADVGTGASLVRKTHTITVTSAMPEPPVMPEEPVMPDPTPTLTIQRSQGSFSGGSVADLHAAAEVACPGGAVIWVEGDSGWGQPYTTDAPFPLLNKSFEDRFAGGLASPTFVWVSRCDQDAMEDEG